MMSSFYQRCSMLQNLCHARQLLVTLGTESFKDYFEKMFNLDKKEAKKTGFAKLVKQSDEYTKCVGYIEETLKASNHPKLRKLAEILTIFFSDEQHKDKSKVIVFT